MRIHVTRLGNGYIAESQMDIAAVGATAEEAVENARRMAIDLFDSFSTPYPATLIVRIEEPHRDSIAMQSMGTPFSLKELGKEFGSYYFDSAGNDHSPTRP
ncbi:MAG TPA: hypothetical protein VIG32_05320 [Candidatus Baltobacteraceae bacterium]